MRVYESRIGASTFRDPPEGTGYITIPKRVAKGSVVLAAVAPKPMRKSLLLSNYQYYGSILVLLL